LADSSDQVRFFSDPHISDFSFTISAEPDAVQPSTFGVHEKTIMKIGGWKTRSVFDRYNIVDEKDLADAAAKLNRKARQRKRHSKGTVPPDTPANDKTSSVN
jgi:hypothetical protein